jgi:hypothetical protein
MYIVCLICLFPFVRVTIPQQQQRRQHGGRNWTASGEDSVEDGEINSYIVPFQELFRATETCESILFTLDMILQIKYFRNFI